MRSALRRYKTGYLIGAILCLIGLIALLVLVWEAWPEVSYEEDPISAFWTFLWTGQFNLISGIEVKPMYLIILSVTALIFGMAVFAFSRQRFFLPGKNFKLQCPFCKKYWKAGYDRGQVSCPHCRHLVHPKLAEE
ncbi:MAG: hypothetical protein JSV51_01080 [Candidatus Bathyarchaeota archaeon]|nr:MAG: hypothetical protein JSV51_01080 [Candidatus Bathyarchaeota archaeon]